jgi:hypothetical protein
MPIKCAAGSAACGAAPRLSAGPFGDIGASAADQPASLAHGSRFRWRPTSVAEMTPSQWSMMVWRFSSIH